MSGSGDNQSAEEVAAKEAQERELKVVQEIARKAPSRSNRESFDNSSSDFDSDSDSSDEDVTDGDDAARKAAKKRKKAKKKKAKKLLKKMIKNEQAKYTHSGFHEVPHNYAQFPGNHPNEKFYSVHLRKPLMGRTIPNGLMTCKCTFTGFTLLFGRLWL
jgi:hypothetical protein